MSEDLDPVKQGNEEQLLIFSKEDDEGLFLARCSDEVEIGQLAPGPLFKRLIAMTATQREWHGRRRYAEICRAKGGDNTDYSLLWPQQRDLCWLLYCNERLRKEGEICQMIFFYEQMREFIDYPGKMSLAKAGRPADVEVAARAIEIALKFTFMFSVGVGTAPEPDSAAGANPC
jgi:hypothetical protein